MKISIRPAKNLDLKEIVALNKKLALFHKKLFPYSDTNTATDITYRRWLSADLKKKTSQIFVAEQNDQIIGFIWGQFSKPAKNIISQKLSVEFKICLLQKNFAREE